ncbi:hypothetical protein ACQP2E_34455 [Actinoplanes sp. CA-015351]|uniref:Uncharacterized protein n=1 Tax=Actinoplanes lutulentus TaxID=1287878 RepID=A0A327Z8D7_9ACTN|nr:hypothetical protein [Actinoplanes lutulentus]MBB2946201.1 hypothetical protein [Actinoplanes lutulentus]RAK32890.1 hypothetical protein B0I29_113187 [Actinoplanes lutulentus]
MSDNSVDPSGNTEAFRAFTRTTSDSESSSSKLPFVIGGVVALVVLIALVTWLAL